MPTKDEAKNPAPTQPHLGQKWRETGLMLSTGAIFSELEIGTHGLTHDRTDG